MSTLNRIDQQMVEEALPIGTTADSNPYDYGKVKAKKTEKKLYTQSEFDEKIGEYANTKLYQEGYKSGGKAAKEKAVIVCEKLSYIDLDYTPLDCAEAIRKSED